MDRRGRDGKIITKLNERPVAKSSDEVVTDDLNSLFWVVSIILS